MACCRTLLLALAVTSLATGKPVDRHMIVEVPQSTSNSDLQDRSETHLESSSDHIESHRPQLHHASSVDKVHSDHNDISKSSHPRKPMPKSIDELQKNPAGGKKGVKKGKKSNSDLLHHLGMVKLRSPAINHHRKRLASQSRKTHHQKSNSDSKMFVIKLPPNPYYYAHHDLNGYDVTDKRPESVNNLPVNFKTNGKPSKVYHWNIPMLKKMVARKAGSSAKSAVFADSDIFNIDKQATWNDTGDDKAVYRKATFYGPKKPSKHTFRKYFAGNGKPHSFYVMEKSKKPASVFRLLP